MRAFFSLRRFAAGMLPALGLAVAAVPWPSWAVAPVCERQTWANERFVVCAVTPAQTDLRLFWRNAQGEAYRRFSAVSEAVSGEGRTLAFAINAGMYGKDFSPIGLYVEAGRQLVPINRQTIQAPPAQVPNFYKQPNGVFYVDDAGAGVLTTEAFLERGAAVRLATQSGPMLVMDNAVNPIFIEGSTDRTRRSGVGVCRDGVVRFVLSEASVNFHDFARVFRDHLQCPNALFLDGGRGAGMYVPALGRNDTSWHGGYGPMLGVVQ